MANIIHFPQQRPNDYGIPVAVEVTYVQDNFLTSDVLNEMVHPPSLSDTPFTVQYRHSGRKDTWQILKVQPALLLNKTTELLMKENTYLVTAF